MYSFAITSHFCRSGSRLREKRRRIQAAGSPAWRHLPLLVHRVLSSRESTQHLAGDFRAHAVCWQALRWVPGRFPGLCTGPQCQNHSELVCWLCCYCARLSSQLAWLEPGIVERRTRAEVKAAIKAAWASTTPQQCHRTPCHAASIRGARTECINEQFSQYWRSSNIDHFYW